MAFVVGTFLGLQWCTCPRIEGCWRRWQDGRQEQMCSETGRFSWQISLKIEGDGRARWFWVRCRNASGMLGWRGSCTLHAHRWSRIRSGLKNSKDWGGQEFWWWNLGILLLKEWLALLGCDGTRLSALWAALRSTGGGQYADLIHNNNCNNVLRFQVVLPCLFSLPPCGNIVSSSTERTAAKLADDDFVMRFKIIKISRCKNYKLTSFPPHPHSCVWLCVLFSAWVLIKLMPCRPTAIFYPQKSTNIPQMSHRFWCELTPVFSDFV